MSARQAFVRTWTVGRYTATLTLPPLAAGVVQAVLEWTPHIPDDLTPDELSAYRQGRDAAVQAFLNGGHVDV
jgi:hypothetical protein